MRARLWALKLMASGGRIAAAVPQPISAGGGPGGSTDDAAFYLAA